MVSKRAGVITLSILTAGILIVFLLLPPIPQSQAYHLFADERGFWGIPNFANVVSNVFFAIIGLQGLVFMSRSSQATACFLDRQERSPYFFVFAGLLLTALGSSYYHLNPNNERLVFDRLPMTLVFMSMVAAVIGERISLWAGRWLLPILLLIGIGSVLQWYGSELQGMGDLRFYAAVQLYATLVLLVALIFPSRYTRRSDLAFVVGFYVLAKIFEVLDKPVLHVGHLVSGHTMKHLAAAAGSYGILRMLKYRKPICSLEDGRGPSSAYPFAPFSGKRCFTSHQDVIAAKGGNGLPN